MHSPRKRRRTPEGGFAEGAFLEDEAWEDGGRTGRVKVAECWGGTGDWSRSQTGQAPCSMHMGERSFTSTRNAARPACEATGTPLAAGLERRKHDGARVAATAAESSIAKGRDGRRNCARARGRSEACSKSNQWKFSGRNKKVRSTWTLTVTGRYSDEFAAFYTTPRKGGVWVGLPVFVLISAAILKAMVPASVRV